jgi:acetyltransferase-like isoleucine patch superfamily enzyme
MELIIKIYVALASRLRGAFYRAMGVRMEGKCWLRAIEIPRNFRDIVLGDGVALDNGVVLLVSGESHSRPKIMIGAKTYVNRCALIDASEEICIGEECMIGPFSYITDHDHVASTTEAPSAGALKSTPTLIEDRCWIGAHVTILKGVTIGRGTVVGAGSVVTKSLPPGIVAVGNPAREIKKVAQ